MKKFFALLILCMLPIVMTAQTQNEKAIIQKISATAQNLKSMQCDFTQTKHLKLLNDKMVSKGKMYYKQANMLRWEYTKPYTYTFILNNTQVLLKKNNRNDVIDVNQNKMFKEIARIMMNSVVGKCLTDTKSFKTSLATTSAEYVATLIPLKKDMKQMFTKIVLHFNKKNYQVTKVEMHEKKGDYTIIELQNVQINKNIDAKVFKVQ